MSNEYGEKIDASTVRFERLLPGPIERVWRYIVDGDSRRRWLCAGDIPATAGARTEMHFHNASLSEAPDIEPPAKYRDMPEKLSFAGRVTACKPPRMIAHTWEFEGEESEVCYELEPVGDKVRLVLTHRRLGSGEDLLSVSGGWHTHLDILAAVLAGDDPPPFWKAHAHNENIYRERFGL